MEIPEDGPESRRRPPIFLVFLACFLVFLGEVCRNELLLSPILVLQFCTGRLSVASLSTWRPSQRGRVTLSAIDRHNYIFDG